METNRDNSAEDRWVHDRLASLEPPSTWQPDSARAFERLTQRNSPVVPQWPRVVVAGALAAAVLVVVLLLPWQFFWTSVSEDRADLLPPLAEDGPVSAAKGATVQGEPLYPTVEVPQVRPAQAPRIPDVRPAVAPVVGVREGLGFTEQETPQMPPRKKKEPGVKEPTVIFRVEPAYTEEAMQARLQGTVELLCLVHEDGTVEVREVTQSLGYGLDESAAGAVQRWRFEPGTKDGQPVPVFTSIRVHFVLK